MSQEKNTSWEERFDEEFDCVMWWGCYNKDGSQKHGYETDCGDELKSFIRQEREAAKEEERERSRIEREALLKEILDEVEYLINKNEPYGDDFALGKDDAFTKIRELIKKKI